MVRKLVLLPALILLIALTGHAQDRVEVFGGYSYERFESSPASNLNGLDFSAQYKFLSWIGLVGDVGTHFGSPFGIDTKTLNVTFGPQISLPTRVSPFFHILGGIGHVRNGGFTNTSFATAMGGGIDMQLVPFVSWRVIQVDDVVTRFYGGTQSSPQISTGIVIKF